MLLTWIDEIRETAQPRELRFEFRIPIEEIEPTLVEIIRREAAAVIVQVLDGRLKRHVHRPHVQLLAGFVGLLEIAGGAGGDDVVPGRLSAL